MYQVDCSKIHVQYHAKVSQLFLNYNRVACIFVHARKLIVLHICLRNYNVKHTVRKLLHYSNKNIFDGNFYLCIFHRQHFKYCCP